jgi:hypothetical protein
MLCRLFFSTALKLADAVLHGCSCSPSRIGCLDHFFAVIGIDGHIKHDSVEKEQETEHS